MLSTRPCRSKGQLGWHSGTCACLGVQSSPVRTNMADPVQPGSPQTQWRQEELGATKGALGLHFRCPRGCEGASKGTVWLKKENRSGPEWRCQR